MFKVTLTIFAAIALAPVQAQAVSRTTCTTWQSGDYNVEKDGVKYNCKSKRTCTTVETDPDGQCRKVFGCHTTIVDEYDYCTKAAVRNPTTGVKPGTRGVLDPGTSGRSQPPFGAPTNGVLSP